MSDPHWIEKAAAKMKKKGTLGSFGKATPRKIAAAKKAGGLQEKKAVFAQNVMKVSHSNVAQHFVDPASNIPEDRMKHYQMGNVVEARLKGITDQGKI